MYKASPNTRDEGNEGTVREQTLRSNEAKGIVVIGRDGKILTINTHARQALHFKGDPPEITLNDFPREIRSLVREIQESGNPSKSIVVSLPAKSGPVRMSVYATLCEGPNPAITLLLTEESAFSKVERNLSRLDRLASVGLVSASMAHEIKNALVPIHTFVQLLLEKNPAEELAAVVRRELTRVDSIANQMLTFAAPAQENFSAVKLHDILEYSLRLVRHGGNRQSVEFDCDFQASPDELAGDDRQLEQVFVNLLFNAIEAMEGSGKVSLRTDLVSDETRTELKEGPVPKLLRVRISDNGPGIRPDQLNHIFEPFFTTKENGTGLGLAVTRRIIREHRGSIHVESAPGKGTTFVILLPSRQEGR